MKKLIWGLVFFILQNWIYRKLSPNSEGQDPRSGSRWMETIEESFRRMVFFTFTLFGSAFTALLALYFVLQSARGLLEQNMGWEPAGVSALYAFVFIGLTAGFWLGFFKVPRFAKPSPVSSQFPVSAESPRALNAR